MKAQAVVCGGGLVGLSIAYQLAKRGARIYLFEKDYIGSHGINRPNISSVNAPMFYNDITTQSIAQKTFEIYSQLNSDEYNPCGQVFLASTDSSEIQLKHLHTRLLTANPKAKFIQSQNEIKARWPMIETEDLKCALFSPDDASINVLALSHVLANRSTELGVKIFEKCAVRRVLLNEKQQVYAVDTDEGLVETSNFINAAGIWSNSIPVKGLSENCLRFPAHPCIYSFLITNNLQNNNIGDDTPFFVDCDEKICITPSILQTICFGFAESDNFPLNYVSHNGIHDLILPCSNWDKFHDILKKLLRRCPSLEKLPHGKLVNGAEMYTPDLYPIVGGVPNINGYFTCIGLNNQGATLAGGLADVLAQRILNGPVLNIDFTKNDPKRFLPLHCNIQYLVERVPEVSSKIYFLFNYTHQWHSARNLRMSPIYHQLKAAGAMFGEIMGYERPLWYTNQNITTVDNIDEKVCAAGGLYSGQDNFIKRPLWFGNVMKEYEACRERVGLIDLTSFSKFDVSGPNVVKLLQGICSANIDKPIGTTIYTGMQNDNGGYVTDCTMSRIKENEYFIIAPTIQQIRLASWLNKWIKEWNLDVNFQDVTGLYTALAIVGPSSRYLMQDITCESMTAVEFPTFSFRELEVGMAAGIRAISVTHCGELGWVLYIPNEVAQNVYEKLIVAGANYGLRHAGYYTLRHLRIEKFYVYWGQDIDTLTNPMECGRSFRVDFEKEFIGKKALLKQLDYGTSKRFVQILIDKHKMDSDPWPQGGEPLFRDNKLTGWTTSSAYGFTLGNHICLGYLENKEFGISSKFGSNGSFQIEIAGKRFPVRLNFHSPSLPMISSEHPNHYRPTQ